MGEFWPVGRKLALGGAISSIQEERHVILCLSSMVNEFHYLDRSNRTGCEEEMNT